MPRTSFVDFKAVKSAIHMEQVLQHYGLLDRFKRGEDSLSGPCPIHKGTNPTQFRVSVSKNCWHCFGGDCHAHGHSLPRTEATRAGPDREQDDPRFDCSNEAYGFPFAEADAIGADCLEGRDAFGVCSSLAACRPDRARGTTGYPGSARRCRDPATQRLQLFHRWTDAVGRSTDLIRHLCARLLLSAKKAGPVSVRA